MPPLQWLCRIAVYALATFRLVSLLTREEGPFGAFDWIRARAGIRYVFADEGVYVTQNAMPQGRRLVKTVNGFWADLLNCPWCLSVWLALPAMACVWWGHWLPDVVATWLAISALACMVETYFGIEDEGDE